MPSESYQYRAQGVQAQRHGSLSIAQARVLGALNCGGMLTERQIKVAASLTTWKARQAVANLASRNLIVTGARQGRYEITELGRDTLTAKASNYGGLEA